MSVSIYAAITETDEDGEMTSPVIDSKHWERENLAEDADERSERGEDPFIPNLDFIENATMSLSNSNAYTVFELIGFKLDLDGGDSFPIDELYEAVARGLNGTATSHTVEDRVSKEPGGPLMVHCGIGEGYIKDKLTKLAALIALGRRMGATEVACV